jgi:hypothetical protein
MKTSIDLPPALLHSTIAASASEGINLSDLVVRLLDQYLHERPVREPAEDFDWRQELL